VEKFLGIILDFSKLTEILSAIFPLAVIGKMNCRITLIADSEVHNVI